MTFAMPVLVRVISAQRTSSPSVFNLEIEVTNHCGNPAPERIAYTRDVRDSYALGLSIDRWFVDNPEFMIEPAPPEE